MSAIPPASSGREARTPEPTRSPWRRWLAAILRVPLFWKLLLPQLMLVAIVVGIAAATYPDAASARSLALALAAGLVPTVALSAWMLRVALRPIDALTWTARRVADGEIAARAPHSPLADRRVERLHDVFNRMLDSLAAARLSQRNLSRQVLAAEERERERIAHELYAGAAHTLAALLIRIRMLKGSPLDPDVATGLDRVASEARTALEEIRTVARKLRPPELDELGVGVALAAYARRLTAEFGVPIRIDGVVPEEQLDPAARLALFRIVQEGLNNAVLHADASRIEVKFTTGRRLRAEVADDGRGFDPAAAIPTTDSHLGLVGMKERAEYVRGTFEVESAPGRGTVLRLDLPRTLLHEPMRRHPCSTRS